MASLADGGRNVRAVSAAIVRHDGVEGAAAPLPVVWRPRCVLPGWFRKQETCRTCGISWRRGYEGFELGALTISAVLVLGVLVVAMGIGIALTLPDVAVVPLLLILGGGAIVLPVLFYPVS